MKAYVITCVGCCVSYVACAAYLEFQLISCPVESAWGMGRGQAWVSETAEECVLGEGYLPHSCHRHFLLRYSK